MDTRCVVISALTVMTLASAAAAGPEWPELGDAGKLPGTAQIPGGSGDLTKIHGQLFGNGPNPAGPGDFQDMYAIYIHDPLSFSASTESAFGGAASFDTQLFLFDSAGVGLLANDNAVGTASTLRPAATDGSGAMLTTPGLYYLAISGFDSDPVSGADLPIFFQADPFEISGPDGMGGSVPITNWLPNEGETGTYSIALTGVSFVPAPGAWALLALGGLARRRRRA